MRAELSFFTASILLNAAILSSIDHVAMNPGKNLLLPQNKMVSKPSGPISFEYVESPKTPQSHKPSKKSSRISDRDSVNQDLTRNKSIAQGPPLAKTAGPSDQLLQKKGESQPQAAAKASPEIQPQAPREKVPQEKKQEVDSGELSIQTAKPEPIKKETAPQSYSPPVRASQAAPPVHSSKTQDRITIAEISRTKSSGVQLYGMTSFEATGSGMGVYMKNLKEKIWVAWFPYLAVHYPKDFKTADAILSIKLNAKGEVKSVQLLENKGSTLFAAICIESVQRAGSFGPLPQEILDLLGKDALDIKFAFHYW